MENRRGSGGKPVSFQPSKEQGGPRKLQRISFMSKPRKVMVHFILDVMSPSKGKKGWLSGGSQCGFTQRRLPLTNLVIFCDVLTSWVDDGTAMDVLYLDFSKAFDTVCVTSL